MKHFIPGPLPDQGRNLLRRAGYGELRNREGQLSYSKRIQSAEYPRYHAYIEDVNGGLQINLHVDQKKASYQGSSAHGGEYDGPLVETEMARLVRFISVLTQQGVHATSPSSSAPPKKKKGLFGLLFD